MDAHADADRARLEQVKTHARELLLPVDGVRGVGVGAGTIRVYVRDRACGRQLPAQVDGVPVEAVVVGTIRAQ